MENAHDAVAFWIDSLVLGRYDRAHMTVEPDQFLLAVAAEGETSELYERLAADGVPEGARVNFWASFVSGFEEASGGRLDTLVVQPEEPFTLFGRQYAVVELTGPEGGVDMVAVLDPQRSVWYLDLFGTFGPALLPLFQPWVGALEDDSGAKLSMQSEADSWRVASERLPDWDEAGRAEIAALLSALG